MVQQPLGLQLCVIAHGWLQAMPCSWCSIGMLGILRTTHLRWRVACWWIPSSGTGSSIGVVIVCSWTGSLVRILLTCRSSTLLVALRQRINKLVRTHLAIFSYTTLYNIVYTLQELHRNKTDTRRICALSFSNTLIFNIQAKNLLALPVV